MNIVRTWTEHNEHEHFVHVCVHHLLEPNLNVQVHVQAQDPWARTKLNRGQSIGGCFFIKGWWETDCPVKVKYFLANGSINLDSRKALGCCNIWSVSNRVKREERGTDNVI